MSLPDATRASLLLRIKDPRDTQAWAEFHDLYAPLLYRYARARGLSHSDAEDIRSSCYEAIVRQIREFVYDRQKGGFKAWLRTLVHRRVVDLLRRHVEPIAESHQIAAIPAADSDLDEVWEQEWREQHLRYCLDLAKMEVPDQTFQAFWKLVYENQSVSQVCESLGMNSNQVYKAKSRILQLVREKMAELGDESDVA